MCHMRSMWRSWLDRSRRGWCVCVSGGGTFLDGGVDVGCDVGVAWAFLGGWWSGMGECGVFDALRVLVVVGAGVCGEWYGWE
eukprot:12572423-Alexandrium_andersonii.AAC.1